MKCQRVDLDAVSDVLALDRALAVGVTLGQGLPSAKKTWGEIPRGNLYAARLTLTEMSRSSALPRFNLQSSYQSAARNAFDNRPLQSRPLLTAEKSRGSALSTFPSDAHHPHLALRHPKAPKSVLDCTAARGFGAFLGCIRRHQDSPVRHPVAVGLA